MLALLLTLLMFPPAEAAATQPAVAGCPVEQALLAESGVKTLNYQDQRTLLQYKVEYGPDFRRAIQNLREHELWLDSGSGQGLALADFMEENPLPRAYGVTLNMDGAKEVRFAQRLHSRRLRFFTGRLIEQIPPEELGQPKVITDFFGPLSYTHDFRRVLQLYLDRLAPGGTLFFTLMDDEARNAFYDLQPATMRAFLGGIAGVELSPVGHSVDVFALRKTKAVVKVPAIRAIRFRAGTPPFRTFVID